MSNIDELLAIPVRMLEVLLGGSLGGGTYRSDASTTLTQEQIADARRRGIYTPGIGKQPSTAAAVFTPTAAAKRAMASGSTTGRAPGYVPPSATQQAYVTHMPTAAPPPVTRRPAGVRFK